MKKNKIKKTYSLLDVIGVLLVAVFISFGLYFIYERINNDNDETSSNQVWCNNCKTFHDRTAAEQETQKLVWCVNSNTYHAPDQE